MSVENYIEKRFNIILGHIREDNKKYQAQNYPEVLDEKKIKEELKTSLVSDGPQTCLEYRDFQFKQKKIDDKKKNKPVPSTSKEIDDFEKFFEDEVSTMYNKSWSRLDKLMRKNKLKEFIKKFCDDNDLDSEKSENFKKLVLNEYEYDFLNKKSEVDYDEKEATIVSLKNLIINKEDDDEITFSFKEKKTKKNSSTTSSYKTKGELAKVITQTRTLIRKAKEGE